MTDRTGVQFKIEATCRPEFHVHVTPRTTFLTMLLANAPVWSASLAIQNNLNFAPSTFVPVKTSMAMRPARSRKPDIENPKELAAEFACAVTEHSTNEADWVARNGDESLFRTLQRMLPEVCTMFNRFRNTYASFAQTMLNSAFSSIRTSDVNRINRSGNLKMDVTD